MVLCMLVNNQKSYHPNYTPRIPPFTTTYIPFRGTGSP